jgi:hypothetical protein
MHYLVANHPGYEDVHFVYEYVENLAEVSNIVDHIPYIDAKASPIPETAPLHHPVAKAVPFDTTSTAHRFEVMHQVSERDQDWIIPIAILWIWDIVVKLNLWTRAEGISFCLYQGKKSRISIQATSPRLNCFRREPHHFDC